MRLAVTSTSTPIFQPSRKTLDRNVHFVRMCHTETGNYEFIAYLLENLNLKIATTIHWLMNEMYN